MLPEVILSLADHRLIGSPLWRPLAYQYGAFWAGLLYGWTPNFATQPLTMFLTHGFLHSDFRHLLGNMAGLVGLGLIAIDRVGPKGFLGLYFSSMLGGAVTFGLMASSPAPMIGASGAVFGLAMAWGVWGWKDRCRKGLQGWQALGPLVWFCLMLAAFNLAGFIVLNGILAWETHLGGCLAGGLWAIGLPRRQA